LSTQIHQNLARFHWGSSWKIQKHICNALGLDNMHASLPVWNISPPLWWFIVVGCLCLLSKAFLIFLIHWLIQVYCMLILHSNVNVEPILGCPRWLLLSLFIKTNHTPKYGITCFIMKEFNKSFTFWILLRTTLWLAMCILPTIIKKFSTVNLILDCQSIMMLPPIEPYSSKICYH